MAKVWIKYATILLMVPLLLCATPKRDGTCGEIPFPWGTEVPFPWSEIEGIWKADFDGEATFYSFHVVTSGSDQRLSLEILILDPVTREIAGKGFGYGISSDRIVEVVIDEKLGIRHRLLVRAYQKMVGDNLKTFTVITDQRLSTTFGDRHAILTKVRRESLSPDDQKRPRKRAPRRSAASG